MAIKEDRALFVECKWQDGVDCEKIKRELKEKAKKVNWKGSEDYAVFARSFGRKSDNCFDLSDILRSFED